MKTFGEYLRSERERRQLSLDDLQRRIRVSMKFLKAFEDDDVANYPQETYARGFLRSYAKAVGLDESGVVKRYQYYLKKHRENEASLRRRRWRLIGRRVALAILPLLVAAFLGGSLYYFQKISGNRPGDGQTAPGGGPEGQGAHPAANSESARRSGLTSSGAASADGELMIQVRATRETWVRVRLDGAREYTVLLGEGETRQWTATELVDVEAGSSSAVVVIVGEQEYPLAESTDGGSGTWHWPLN